MYSGLWLAAEFAIHEYIIAPIVVRPSPPVCPLITSLTSLDYVLKSRPRHHRSPRFSAATGDDASTPRVARSDPFHWLGFPFIRLSFRPFLSLSSSPYISQIQGEALLFPSLYVPERIRLNECTQTTSPACPLGFSLLCPFISSHLFYHRVHQSYKLTCVSPDTFH
ncbi:hypothetical protein F5148DRAFT_214937 [Russula earlei]|uniref:Uncharacterized protein n=1 Tax=Russula earlei TaxID=71964 RepID=A0ACC0U626_9AGAM|nr:hypothetical protein F5148DRAFT_214937 [Russula earlei]